MNISNNFKNPIPNTLQTILQDLNFLSQIKRGYKPCISDRVIVSADTWSGALYRFFKGENRIKLMCKVEQIINNTVEAIENPKYIEHLNLTVNSLNEANNGLLNLLHTYDNDPDMKSRLNVQLQNVDIQLIQYKHLIKGYIPNNLNNSNNVNNNNVSSTNNNVSSTNNNLNNSLNESSNQNQLSQSEIQEGEENNDNDNSRKIMRRKRNL